MTTPTTKRNSLTLGDRMRVAKWFESHQQEIASKELSKTEVARWVSNELDLYVTPGNLNGIAGEREGAFIQFKWPRAKAGLARNARLGQLRLMFQMIETIRDEVGITPDGELARLWINLGEQLGEDTFKLRQMLEIRD